MKMNVSKIIGAILVVVSFAVGYIAVNRIADSTKTIKFLGIRIDASNESGQIQGYIFLGLAILIFVGGIYAIVKTSKAT
jgi:hypothetical protein